MRSLLALFIFGILLLCVSPAAVYGNSGDVVVSAFQIAGDNAADDFIELYNPSDQAIPLADYSLRRKTKSDISATGTSVKSFSQDDHIPAYGYFLWAGSDSSYAAFADATTGASLTDDNSLGLFRGNVLIDAVTFGSGQSMPFVSTPTLANPSEHEAYVRSPDTFSWSKHKDFRPRNRSGTTFAPAASDPVSVVSSPIRINEFLPNPEDRGEKSEFIELYNASDETLAIGNWEIKDASRTGRYVFLDDIEIPGRSYLVLTKETSGLSLNNSDETLSFFNADGALVQYVTYAKTKEGVSLNYVSGKWRGGTPTPGAENILNALPEIKERVPKKGYRGVSLSFRATGSDADGETLKYTWHFGDGHKSYKDKTSHVYEKNGIYTVRLITTDGNEDIEETWTVKISSYPHYKNLRITELVPNPAGNDTDNEWLIIRNDEKKTIDLKGYGIATGWKKLVNHPVRESLLLPPGKSLKLTRLHSLFTLPNEKGKVELRAPDGKILQKIRYELNRSAAENAVYRKEKGKSWVWHEEHQNPEATETSPLSASMEPDNASDETNAEEIAAQPKRSVDKTLLPSPAALLAFGTRLRTPVDVFAPLPDPEPIALPLPEERHYVVRFADTLAEYANHSFNVIAHSVFFSTD